MKKILYSLLVLFILSWILICCSEDKESNDQGKKQIEDLYERYFHYVASNNLDSFMSVWADDAYRSEPGFTTIKGKEAIRESFREKYELFYFTIVPLGQAKIEVRDDLAYGYRTVTLLTVPKDRGDTSKVDINVLTIFKKQADGEWKLQIDCMNFHPTWSMDSIPDEISGEGNPYY